MRPTNPVPSRITVEGSGFPVIVPNCPGEKTCSDVGVGAHPALNADVETEVREVGEPGEAVNPALWKLDGKYGLPSPPKIRPGGVVNTAWPPNRKMSRY